MRTRAGVGTALAAVVSLRLLAGAQVAEMPADTDWPLFRGTPSRVGGDGTSVLPDRAPVVAWVFTDGKTNFPVTFWSSPFLHDKRLYVGGGVLSPFGTRGYIYCLDALELDPASGKPRVIWKYKVGALVFSSPSLVGGVVVCGEGTHTDTGASLHALNADSERPGGEQLWDFKVAGTVEASPCIAGGNVYFGTGDDFYCLDLKTGRQQWRTTIVDVLSSPIVAGGMVYVGSGRSEQARPENRNLQGRQLLALNATNGAVLWRQELPFACNSPITYADGRLIAGAGKGTFILTGGRSAGEVICHDVGSGRPLWSRPLPDNVLAAIPVENGFVHAACRDGKFYLLSSADGALLWEYKADSALLASPVVSGDRVLLVSCRGVAHCLDFRNRAVLWTLDLPRIANLGKTAEVFSSPVLAGGRIYVGLGGPGLISLRSP